MVRYANSMLDHAFPDGLARTQVDLQSVQHAYARLEYCFLRINRKYYVVADHLHFDHLNGDHMASFLWFLGNTLWTEREDVDLATRLSYLNKTMHGLDLFHSVKLPDIFLLVHPVGTVIGGASFEDYLVVYQQVTIGATDLGFPTLGSGTVMYAGSAVIGACTVGDDVVFAAHAMLIDQDVPAGSLVLGKYPHHRIQPNTSPTIHRVFGHLS